MSEKPEVMQLSAPNFQQFARYILKDCASTPWDSYMRRVYRTLGLPDGLEIPPAPTSRFDNYGMSPGMWHKAALSAGSYSLALEALGVAEAFNANTGLEDLKRISASAHAHPLAPLFTHGVRKFTAEQQATLNLLVSPHMKKLISAVGIDAMLGFLPAIEFIDGYGYADLSRLIDSEGVESIVPLKPSQVADSPLGRVLTEAFDVMDSTLADMLEMPESIARIGWFLAHPAEEWDTLDAPIAVREALPGYVAVEASETKHFTDMALF